MAIVVKFSESPRPIPNTRDDSRPRIDASAGLRHDALQALTALVRSNPGRLRLHGARIVCVENRTREAIGGGATQSLEFREKSPAELLVECDERASFFRVKTIKNFPTEVTIDCPPKLASALFDSPAPDLLPRIERIAEVPLLLDGTLVSSGLHRGVHVDAPDVAVPMDLSRREAELALTRLHAWLDEFPYATPRDQAAAVALMLTTAMRPSQAAAPGFVISKPQYGAGASTLAKLVGIVGTGRIPAMLSTAGGVGEFDKVLGSALIQGRQLLVLDNLPEGQEVRSSLLSIILTEPQVDVRELGRSRNHTIDTGRLVVMTGVNVSPARDLQRRVLRIELAPQCESPETRVFKRPRLLDEAREARADILRDIFTVILAYRQAPERVTVARLAGYDAWADACVAPLVWLGLPDPITEVAERTADDPTRIALLALLPLLPRQFTVKGLLREADPQVIAVLGEAAGNECGEPDARRVGHFLSRIAGRPVEDRRLVRDGSVEGAVRWTVQLLADSQPKAAPESNLLDGQARVMRVPRVSFNDRARGKSDDGLENSDRQNQPIKPFEPSEYQLLRQAAARARRALLNPKGSS